jgi:hypothetical protein
MDVDGREIRGLEPRNTRLRSVGADHNHAGTSLRPFKDWHELDDCEDVGVGLESLARKRKAAPKSPPVRRLGDFRAGVDLVSRV